MKKILIYNSGGGLGDSIQLISLISSLQNHLKKTEFFYFVADGNGGHAFAKTLNQHNRNVAKWRKLKNGG